MAGSPPLPDPDTLAAPALRRALTQERAKRVAAEQEAARLRGALGRQQTTLARLEALVATQGRQLAALTERVTALTRHNTALQTDVATLRAENARLREALAASGPGGAGDGGPPAWVKAKTPRPPTKPPRKKRAAAHNAGRRRVPAAQVQEQVRHAVDACPACGTGLAGGWVHRRVQVIDLPAPAPAVVTEHLLLARQCRGCGRRVLPPPPGLPAARVGRCRFGPRLLAAVAVMRTVERLPLRQIQARLAREHNLPLSTGGLVRLLRAVAARATPAYAALGATVRGSPTVHADETGWREDGQHGYIWTFSTPTVRYFHHALSRSGDVPEDVLGVDFEGTLVTDFYAAYDRFGGPHQRCWSHLWRDLKDLLRQHPHDAALAAWVAGLGTVYRAATAPRPAREVGDTPAAAAARARRARDYERQLSVLCPTTLPRARPEAVLATRIRRYLPELFTFVRDPRVPPTNNAAERSIRPLVIARKISGGTRSAAGSRDRMVLASVLGTAQLRGHDLLATCQHLLLTPPPP